MRGLIRREWESEPIFRVSGGFGKRLLALFNFCIFGNKIAGETGTGEARRTRTKLKPRNPVTIGGIICELRSPKENRQFSMIPVQRTGIRITPNPSRVLFRPFLIADEKRILKIIARVLSLSEEGVRQQMETVLSEFRGRHQKLAQYLLRRYESVKEQVPTDESLSASRKMLIGAYFTLEYSLESAALFNPSMVWHPDQSGLPEGTKRFILSLRSVGEGHISSITFHSGTVDSSQNIVLDDDSPYVISPETVPNTSYEKPLFEKKLLELNRLTQFATDVLATLEDNFTLDQLRASLTVLGRQYRLRQVGTNGEGEGILGLAQANYELVYPPDTNIAERIIFPSAPNESNGIEDARFVRFVGEKGKVTYYATYTAYDGRTIFPQLLETDDFLRFKVATLNGPEVQNKGMALFPRLINGRYAMISRQDGENIYIMSSDNLHFWYSKQLLLRPTYPWEFVQLGNCGSPIETEAGWLLLTHGVGPMRKYAIGAALLDLENPAKVIKRLRTPLLSAEGNEREGYVPNVVYSCGGALNGRDLILPYAMSDYASSFAIISLDDILNAMEPVSGEQ